MAKKAAKASAPSVSTASAPAKPAAKKEKKHLKAQAAAVAAAVEGFVHAIVAPHDEVEDEPEVIAEAVEHAGPATHFSDDEPSDSVAGKPVEVSHVEVSHEEISKLAFTFYLQREGKDGSALEDWIRAERQLSAAPAETAAKPLVFAQHS